MFSIYFKLFLLIFNYSLTKILGTMKIFSFGILFLVGIGIGSVVNGMVRKGNTLIPISVQPIEYMSTAPGGFEKSGGGSCGS